MAESCKKRELFYYFKINFSKKKNPLRSEEVPAIKITAAFTLLLLGYDLQCTEINKTENVDRF